MFNRHFKHRNSRRNLWVSLLEDRCTPASYLVNSANDLGAGTLRQAILDANATVGVPDTITFDTSTAPFNGPATISLDTALPFISDDLTITGTGISSLTINRSGIAGNIRILGVTDGNASKIVNATISNLKLTGGFSLGLGGGFAMDNENVTLNSVEISGNEGANGGGIGVGAGGQLTVINSTISGNTATNLGGGIFVNDAGSFNLNGSAVVMNNANHAPGTYLYGGGGIFLGANGSGTWTIRNTTISGNTSADRGGGILAASGSNPNFNVFNSTITENNGTSYGGGIYLNSATIVTTLTSSIIAKNTSVPTSIDIDSPGTVTATNCLIGSKDGITTYVDINSIEGDMTTQKDPMLNPLALNGGTTLNHLPLSTSEAKNAGLNPSPSQQFDQRGNVRSFGQTDIGAVELSASDLGVPGTPTARGTFADITNAGGTTHVLTITYEDAGGGLTGFGLDDIRVTAPNGYNKTPTSFKVVSNSGTVAVIEYTIPSKSSPTPWNKADNDTYTVLIEPGAPTDGVLAVPTGSNGQFRVQVNELKVLNILNSGPGSLRQAILDANAVPGPDTITFDPAFFDNVTTRTITLSSGEMAINGELVIQGLADKTKLVIDANKLSRIFNLEQAINFKVTINGMTLTNGQVPTGVANRGATIRMNDETLTLNNVTISNGLAVNTRAGAIAVQGPGTLNINDSLLDNNDLSGGFFGGAISGISKARINIVNSTITGSDGAAGGAIYVGGSYLTLDKTTISGSTAQAGGAIASYGSFLSMTNSTISGNTATNAAARGGGGLLAINTAPGGLDNVIRNSTFSGNTSAKWGGGISLYGFGGQWRIYNSTIASNSATGANTVTFGGGQMFFPGGGGILEFNAIGKLEMISSIVADNTSPLSEGPDLYSKSAALTNPAVASFNIFEDPNGFDLAPGSVNNQNGDPGLGPLQNNGGPTFTHLPASPGIAIDKGNNPVPSVSTDQRGGTRNYGPTDVGSVEFAPPNQPFAQTTLTPVTTPGATSYAITITYSDDLIVGDKAIKRSTLGDTDIKVMAPDGSFSFAKLTSPLPPYVGPDPSSVVATYNFTPPGGSWDGGDAGIYTVIMQSGEVTDTLGNPVQPGVLGTFLVDLSRTIIVTNTNDSGVGSLRQAIADANITSAADTISFASGVGQAFEGAATITLTSGQIAVAAPLSINGTGSNKLTIDGNNNDRHLALDGPGKMAVSISGATLTHGKRAGGFTTDVGGSIYSADEQLSLNDVRFIDNVADRWGGAIGLRTADCTVTGTNVVFQANQVNNYAKTYGGAIMGFGNSTISLTNSRFTGNKSTTFSGGAMWLQTGSVLSLTLCTISGNEAALNGGGIYFNNGGTLTMDRSTISGNIADSDGNLTGDGGGLYFYGAPIGTNLVIKNSTISGNKAANGGGIQLTKFATNSLQIQNSTIAFNEATGNGGGVNVIPADAPTVAGTVTLISSIVAKNTSSGIPDFNDFNGAVTANSRNFIGDQNGAIISGGTPLSGDPMLNPVLASNGAPVGAPLSHALLSGSPAIDQGENIFGFTTDQTGGKRTIDNPMIPNAVGGDGTDIGAFEVPGPPTVVSVLTNGVGPGQHSMVTSIVVTFSANVTIANPAAAFNLFLYEKGAGGITGSVGLTVSSVVNNSVTITFNGSGTVGIDPGGSLQDGRYRLTIVATEVVGAAGFLDGNGNGKYDPLDPNNDNNLSTTWRLFGDANGSGNVDSTDFALFRTKFGLPLTGAPEFNYFGDAVGNVGGSQFAEFRKRFGLSGYAP